MSRPAARDDVDDICRSLPEMSRDELAEIITEAWACKAPRSLVRKLFGDA